MALATSWTASSWPMIWVLSRSSRWARRSYSLLLDLAGRDLGPQLDDPGQVFHREGGGALVGQTFLCAELELLALQYSQPSGEARSLLARSGWIFPVPPGWLLLELRQLVAEPRSASLGWTPAFLLAGEGWLCGEFVKGRRICRGGRQHDLPLLAMSASSLSICMTQVRALVGGLRRSWPRR